MANIVRSGRGATPSDSNEEETAAPSPGADSVQESHDSECSSDSHGGSDSEDLDGSPTASISALDQLQAMTIAELLESTAPADAASAKVVEQLVAFCAAKEWGLETLATAVRGDRESGLKPLSMG